MYQAYSYLCTNFCGVMSSIETDSYSEIEEFVHEQCMSGYNCEIVDVERGSRFCVLSELYIKEVE